MTSPPDPMSPRARSLLDAARDGLGPDDAAIARMRARVLAGAGGGIGVAAATKASALGTGAKLALATLAVAVLGGGTWWLVRDGASGKPSKPTATAIAAGTEAGTGTGTELRNRVPKPSPETETAAEPETETAAEPETASRNRAPTPSPEAATDPARPVPARRRSRANATSGSLADEVLLVDDAMAALRRDDPSAALAAADDHVARFARRGQLAEEAAAIRVEALCRLGDTRWSAAFDDFDLRYPRSAQRPRLSAACKGAP